MNSRVQQTRQNRHSGFSLVEMAIVMTISGLLLSGFLEFYSVQLKKHRIETTKDRLENLRAALTDYVATHDRLPCPASSMGLPKAGGDYDPCAPDATQLPEGVVARMPGDQIMGRDQNLEVWIGVVPTRDLRLDSDEGRDGWGNEFTYAVSRRLTLPKGMRGNPVPTGIIPVVDENGNSVLDKPGTGRYVIVSHGPSGSGRWTPEGVRTGCQSETLASKNCKDTGVFLVAPFSTATGQAFYDNFVIYDGSDAGGNLLNRIAVCNLKRRFYIPTDETSDEDGCARDKGLWQGACLQQIIVDLTGALLPSVPYAVMHPAIANGTDCACAPGYSVVKVGTSYDTSPIFTLAPPFNSHGQGSGRQHTQTVLYTCTQ